MEQRLLNGELHGLQRTWYRNGQLADESEYRHGLRHGLARQWDTSGKLLGSFQMEKGTGVYRNWHDNGRLAGESGMVEGKFCGRKRAWLRDGTLTSDEVLLFNREVTPEQYRRAAAKDSRLPKLTGRIRTFTDYSQKTENRSFRLFIEWLLAKPNGSETKAWLSTADKVKRQLGRFKHSSVALEFIEKLYQAGAVKVTAPDIYRNKHGNEFADCLVVQLPKDRSQRKMIRSVCGQLKADDVGAFMPEKDAGEAHLYLSMDA